MKYICMYVCKCVLIIHAVLFLFFLQGTRIRASSENMIFLRNSLTLTSMSAWILADSLRATLLFGVIASITCNLQAHRCKHFPNT